MTDRIYYTDPSCTEFDATVVRCDTVDGRIIAVLDRTAFYPTSGGSRSTRVPSAACGSSTSSIRTMRASVTWWRQRWKLDRR